MQLLIDPLLNTHPADLFCVGWTGTERQPAQHVYGLLIDRKLLVKTAGGSRKTSGQNCQECGGASRRVKRSHIMSPLSLHSNAAPRRRARRRRESTLAGSTRTSFVRVLPELRSHR